MRCKCHGGGLNGHYLEFDQQLIEGSLIELAKQIYQLRNGDFFYVGNVTGELLQAKISHK
jgi:hypothetical protein